MPIWIFTGLASIFLACVSGYFSITGLAALYSASFLSVVIMGSAIEFAKIVSTFWLHRYFHEAPKLISIIMMVIVIMAMMVTSGGVYGYLTKGHTDQTIPLTGVNLKLERIEQQIQQNTNIIERAESRLSQLDSAVQTMINEGFATKGLSQRNKQKAERDEIKKSIDQANTEIDELNTEKLTLKQSTVEIDAKLGPIKYLAELFGADADWAVKYFTLLMVILLDPFAIMLVIATSISFTLWTNKRKKKKEDSTNNVIIEEKPVIDEPKIEEIITEKIDSEIDKPEINLQSNEDSIVDYLEDEEVKETIIKNPDLIEPIEKIIDEIKQKRPPENDGWFGPGNPIIFKNDKTN